MPYEFDVEIMSVGTWNKDKFTKEDLENIAFNFDSLKDTVKPFLKLGHNLKQEDGKPAMGWVKVLKVSGDKLIATLTQVPEKIYKAIKGGRYKRLSAEIYFNFKDKAGNIRQKVLRAVALLGADVPAVDNLADLDKYLTQSIQEGLFEQIKGYSKNIILFNNDDNKESITESKINKEKKKMADKIVDEKTIQELKEFKDKLAIAEKEAKAFKKESEDNSNKLKEYEEKREAKEKEEKKNQFITFCEEAVKEGKLVPSERDRLVGEFSYIGGRYMLPFEAFKEFLNGQKVILDLKEYGHSEDDNTNYGDYATVEKIVGTKTKEYAEKHKVNYEDALLAVLDSDKKLADAYIKR